MTTTTETAPCLDCGMTIHYIDEPWCAVDGGGVCVPCGRARYGDHIGEYLLGTCPECESTCVNLAAHAGQPYCGSCDHHHAKGETHCPNCGQPARSGFHATWNLDKCPIWIDGRGWVPRADTTPAERKATWPAPGGEAS